ncbi:hypothetical protein, conserved [Trypanosoma brucei brucei TREU927]|uniref:Purine-responsive element-binding protein 1 n=1 Tax=Trypanosoma brucei brucei (strain 927/4 GUTat10.1) TaxID=185431 RepID=PRBP1_TRYB2|nr:hypothetical protein, conserved [Trypanosoma brucei brucei TREU927]AAX80515.1 hypothetical protein, conserved [Trypanosoma brucei]AAZ11045.1 hypothetical protein, conserved [Trypanosoma brucei brucei TREU927]
MGALPSRETQRRGLYSHRHGRNRRSEVILVPLTTEFFPSESCPLFERLFQARHHRTAKYYYRAVRSADTDRESDYYCQTTVHANNADLDSPGSLARDKRVETLFTDDISGLYQRLVRETECCMSETDEGLRERYKKQIQQQQRHQQRQQQYKSPHPQEYGAAFGDSYEEYFGFGPGAFANGYNDALAYIKGREQHTHCNEFGTHVTSPSAYYLRPVPCAIVSRSEAHKSAPDAGVEFLGSTVKVLGMFGLLPSTISITVHGEVVEQHMLKATMFVDKDVGDQILGNVVMLAVHMYVRQCIEAQIRAPYIPMIPMILRTPISNIPMLQFVREMRVRLRSLLNAGGKRRSFCSANSSGSSASSSPSTDSVHDAVEASSRCDADILYLFEEDVPGVVSQHRLFLDPSEAQSLKLRPAHNTNPDGTIPILLVSGVNVQATPLTHPSVTSMSHVRVPPWVLDGASDSAGGGPPNSCPQREAFRAASLLATRRNRFRMWVEDGRLCIWASAAYARRGCLMLAQQLTQTVDNSLLPIPRPWNYRGLLRGGMPMPEPELANDVFIVAEDMPSMGLYQGDVLRCSTPAEIGDRQRRGSPCKTPGSNSGTSLEMTFPHTKKSLNSTSTLLEPATPAEQKSPPVNYTSNHPSNVLLQDPGEAPSNAFWVCFPFDRDGPSVAPGERRQQQQQQDGVAYRATNVEEVLLSWIKIISLKTRDAAEEDDHWVRDPTTGAPLRVDRYIIRRVEHDGMRYFIGVTPRFVGQQRRLEKMLVDIKAQEDGGEDLDLERDKYYVAAMHYDAAFDREDDDSRDEDALGRVAMAKMLSAPSLILE